VQGGVFAPRLFLATGLTGTSGRTAPPNHPKPRRTWFVGASSWCTGFHRSGRISRPRRKAPSPRPTEQTIPANTPNFASVLGQAITAHGYPAAADISKINYPMTVLLLSILVIFVTLVYAPIAAWLVELFPTRIRYSGLSLPYHIGNGWFGGFLPRDRVRHRGSDRQHLLRSLVPDRDRMHESRRRLLLPA
jgi:hypothetical protein